MSWSGKILGGSIGSFFGPLGAVAGMAAGHLLFDRNKQESRKVQAGKLLAVSAAALYELARVDGRYKAKENKVILQILEELNSTSGGHFSLHELSYMLENVATIDSAWERMLALARDDKGWAITILCWMWRVAVCDCELTSAESTMIEHFANATQAPQQERQLLQTLYTRQNISDAAHSAAYKQLGVSPHADAAQIKSAYRTLSQTYHPDKHANLDPAIKALTTEKFTQIKSAYETLMNSNATLYAIEDASGRLVPANTLAKHTVRCFYCSARVRLPNSENIQSARCPSCQVLLSFEHNTAVQLQ